MLNILFSYSPLTTNLTGELVSASCVVKSLAVTWHSHRPSSKSKVADRIHNEQSPPDCTGGCKSKCKPFDEEERLPAHSYFFGYIPTGCKCKRDLQKGFNYFLTKSFYRLI